MECYQNTRVFTNLFRMLNFCRANGLNSNNSKLVSVIDGEEYMLYY